MSLDFAAKDVIHQIVAKFTHAFLPEAKKPYNLRAVHQPELDVPKIIAVNEPRTLKIIVPALNPGTMYLLMIVTQSSAKGHSNLLKTVRELHSDFTLTAQV